MAFLTCLNLKIKLEVFEENGINWPEDYSSMTM